jgi:acyl-CoA synthetase (AMP-forming)/AMP-acid ligase II
MTAVSAGIAGPAVGGMRAVRPGEITRGEIVNTADDLLAVGAGDDVALVDGPRRMTYDQLRDAAALVAGALDALALAPGSRVAIVGPNSGFWVAAYLATMKLGLVAVPLPDKLPAQEFTRYAEWVDCDAVLLDRRVRRRYADAVPAGVPVLDDGLLDHEGPRVWPHDGGIDPDADAVLMFTSGTTSRPKAVRVTHRNIRANTESIISYLALQREDRILVVLPFFYCFGASLLHTHLRVGARLVLCNSFAFPETAIEQLAREECTEFAGVPSSLQLLLRASSFAKRSLPSLRLVQQAGGRLHPVLVQELLAAQPQASLFVMYGQTEATARLSYLPPDQLATRPGSIGRGIPGVELSVLDDHGAPVAPGAIGEIVARGASISPGYYRDPEATALRFSPGELRTGDLATVDDEGYVYVVDRKEDFIKSWGYRVSSQEVEACALRLRDLVSAAAVGIDDLEAGEAIHLFVTVRPGATVTGEDVLAVTRAHLPKHMVPHAVHVLDAMPTTANGKISKSRLRELGRPDEG